MMPHGVCFLWNSQLLSLEVGTNLLIMLSYYYIAFILFSILHTVEVPLSRSILFLFGWFILACGTTHLVDVIVIWYPLYWLQSGVLVATVIPSLWAAIFLFRLWSRTAETVRITVTKAPLV